jgi:ABC-type transport system substrate-binding protein
MSRAKIVLARFSSGVSTIRKVGASICSSLAVVLIFSAAAARAQQTFDVRGLQPNAQDLIIGLLTGQSDYRNVKIETRDGIFRIYGQGNSRPFEMLEGNPERMVISFRYQGSDAASRNLARPQKIIYEFFSTDRRLISAIILDQVDYTVLESEAAVAEIGKATRKYRILPSRAVPHTVEMICYNLAHPFLRDRVVRQALSYAINREEIKRRLFLNKADIAVGPLESNSRFFPPGMNDYGYNPKKALALLSSAGWRDTNRDRILDRNGEPFRFRIYYDQSTQLKEEIVRQIKINWNQIGVDVTPSPLSAVEINDRLQAGNFDAVLTRYIFEETLASLENFFSSTTGRSFLNYHNSRLQQNFINAKRYQGTEAFRPIVQRIQIIINEDQPVNFLYHPWLTWHVINQAKFGNFQERNGILKPFPEWELRISP